MRLCMQHCVAFHLGRGGGGSHHDKQTLRGVVRLLLAIVIAERISCFRVCQHSRAWLSANLCCFLPEEFRYYSRHDAGLD